MVAAAKQNPRNPADYRPMRYGTRIAYVHHRNGFSRTLRLRISLAEGALHADFKLRQLRTQPNHQETYIDR